MREEKQPALRHASVWRRALFLGLLIAVGILFAKVVEHAATDSLGGRGAFGVSILAGAAVGVLIAFAWHLWFKR